MSIPGARILSKEEQRKLLGGYGDIMYRCLNGKTGKAIAEENRKFFEDPVKQAIKIASDICQENGGIGYIAELA